MTDSYIPTPDGLALTWIQTFAYGISANPATAADAANIQNVVDDYAAAHALAVDPSTRTPVNVAAKDDTRNIAEQHWRIRILKALFPQERRYDWTGRNVRGIGPESVIYRAIGRLGPHRAIFRYCVEGLEVGNMHF